MRVEKDGRSWRVGTDADVQWIRGRPPGLTVETAMPLRYDAYATFHPADHEDAVDHEHAVVAELVAHTTEQPWWLGFLDTGAHDVVFPGTPMVSLYWDWRYVVVEGGADQALGWRSGHMRHQFGALPDLLFPADRSWLVTALWDHGWTCVGGPLALVDALVRDPTANARRIEPHEDTLPPGLVRD